MITNTTNVNRYIVSGSTYSITFGYWNKNEIKVYLTNADGTLSTLTLGTDYTLTDPNGTSGTLTKVSDWGTATKITIQREVALDQDKDFINGQTLDADKIEEALDHAIAATQQIQETISRSMLTRIDEAGQSFTMPGKTQRQGSGSGTMMGFDSTGNAITLRDLAQFDADVQSASTNAGNAASSASNAAASEAKAQKWAEENEDTPVETGKYSAKHYAEKASDSATSASGSANTASTAKDDAVTAKNDAVTAKDGAISAKNDAVQAKTDAQAAQLAAETAEDGAEAAQQKIENMTVSAEGLSAGSNPSVTKTEVGGVVNLHYGIPKGDKGDTGETGATGQAAGFGTPTATASGLPAGSSPTVGVVGSGADTSKVFAFTFGIPKGDKGDTGTGTPAGGTAGQVLKKASSTDYDFRWDEPDLPVNYIKSVTVSGKTATFTKGDDTTTDFEPFTSSDQTKLDGISTGANKVEASTNNGNIKIDNVETNVYTHPGSGTNPHGTTASDVGLGNVGNFKAVSTVASQVLNDTEKGNARANIEAVKKVVLTCTLPTSGWVSDEISISVSGVLSSDDIWVCPAASSYDEYCECGIRATSHSDNAVVFARTDANTNALSVKIMRLI